MIQSAIFANMANKKPPVIRKSTLPSSENDMANVVHKGVIMPIRKEEIEVWNGLNSATKDKFLKKWQKLVSKQRITEDKKDSPVKLFKK